MTTRDFNMHFLLHSAALIEDRLRQRLADVGIPPRQARMLDALGRAGTASQADLARAFNIKPASMSTMTTRLIDAGLISREVDPNETRSNILRLSARGQGLLSDIHTAWRDIDRLIEDRLGAENAALLTDLTQQLRDGLGGEPPAKTLDQSSDGGGIT
ncbi:DNA-binding MarR family transcriptional regulator [Loktanella ponticola]|uniref:DNA-binding MarR family transcriptional regulator n=1 Tax=Yoonia ponticola TaxID=1524255 RepID=A0A7W9BK33_9RHOB|nr:MarR family winged helix-turn-helix transcriptional regulator [Yoonia ponticola]MBB5721544.1 DNA-binding MarR family transcriptional regulator [Yoonia ponticola]